MGNILENIAVVLPDVLREEQRLAPYKLHALLASQMENNTVNPDWVNAKPGDQNIKAFPLENETWNLTDRLRVKSGKYLSSFLPNNPNTETKAILNENGLVIDFGTKLPRLHEVGGFITSKGKMHKYFWAMYYKSKNHFFEVLALSVMKKGGVNVKKRPHFEPALTKFKEQADIWLNSIFKRIMDKANGI